MRENIIKDVFVNLDSVAMKLVERLRMQRQGKVEDILEWTVRFGGEGMSFS